MSWMFQKRRWESVEAGANYFQLEAWHETQATGVSKAVKSSHLLPSVTTIAICHYYSTSFLRLSQTCPQNIPKQKEQKVEENPKYSGRQSRFLFLLNCKHTFYVNAGDTSSGTCDGRAIVLTHCTTSLALLESSVCNSLFFLVKDSGKLAFGVPASICLGECMSVLWGGPAGCGYMRMWSLGETFWTLGPWACAVPTEPSGRPRAPSFSRHRLISVDSSAFALLPVLMSKAWLWWWELQRSY